MLKSSLSFDIKHDTVVGFEDYGSFKVSKPRLATHALVFMVRGLCKKWKQVFGYFFSCESASSAALTYLLHEAVRELVQCRLDPIAVVCDQGANNQRLYKKELGITPEKPYFFLEDYEKTVHKVYALFDAPHLLKSMRNNFIKYDIKFLHNNSVKFAQWKHLYSAWEFDKDMPHRYAHKLTKQHVDVDGLNKMSVKLASQALSHSVTSVLCNMIAAGKLAGSGTADFCALMNDLFDSVNGRLIFKEDKPLLSAVSNTSPHLESWKTFTDFLKSVEFQTQGKKIRFPCLEGWLITLSAFRQLVPELLVNIPYILMSRFTQDCLENFFSVVRRKGGNNDHPSPVDFRSRIRMLMAEHLINVCNSTNCEPDEDAMLVPLEVLLNPEVQVSEQLRNNEAEVNSYDVAEISNNIVTEVNIISEVSDPDTCEVNTDNTDIFNDAVDLTMDEANSGVYVGGYIAKVTLKKFQCKDCQENLTKEKMLSRDLLFIYFKEYDIVKDGLKAPSDSWLKTICEFGRSFNSAFNINCNEPGLTYNIICKYRDIDHDWLNCTTHANEIWEYILKKYVLLMVYHKLKRISKDIYNEKRAAKKRKKHARSAHPFKV